MPQTHQHTPDPNPERPRVKLLLLVEELVALIAGARDGVPVPQASFLQPENVRAAVAAGDPQWLIQQERGRG
ncbi:hypothetical protein [Dactylosporangium sp. NBC_01737]|uniref:hypothetical protein n=1 Tax=Dactylosporangium sp. NBC_01737 TaxID=2975959 RepID=UPI003FA397F2